MIIICINTVTLCYKVQIAKVITFRYNDGIPSKGTSGNNNSNNNSYTLLQSKDCQSY